METVLRDPIHNYIYLQDEVILKLINTKEMQRLRRIKQLGTTNSTFHGAEHSRFTHSVGVYEISRQICDLFQRNYPSTTPGDGNWDNNERLVTLCAALLHDVGHGAYSHTFEHIFHTDHEAMTVQIIKDPRTEVNQVLRQVAPDFPAKVASVIQKTYPNPQVVQMISSQIDADRMDYLLRDSYYTGTNYGNFDIMRIMRVMRPYQNGIAFDLSGMHAVEDYVLSRFQMYQQIYFHQVSRGMEVLLTNLLARARYLAQNNLFPANEQPTLLLPFFQDQVDLLDYLRLDDYVLNSYFNLWTTSSDPILSDLAQRFLNRKPFKSIQIISEEHPQIIAQIQQIAQEHGFDPEYYTGYNDCFDLPYDAYDPTQENPRTQIELMKPNGELTELSTESSLVSAITGKESGDLRFYFPKEIQPEVNQLNQQH
ncbi:deoxyguanosinetriphosphate triphosphohydrolase [Ligilactobacillus ceti DSM 22408]|uniref:Deoxyguanosinetriphosphate triphosphohydrolase n=2 Tax=Ligilactobacillus TaxID=2767887 RepID=A0A0R2KJ37_9LACO|nr:deoxyguanosinetriphosphate triphosphohydrolase [Ligilactobacillus ceti DSM 22408]